MQKRERRWPWIAASIVVAGMFVASFVDVEVAPEGDPRPVGGVEDIATLADRPDLNVLFILIDTLRADRLGAYGYERDTSPVHIDAIEAFVHEACASCRENRTPLSARRSRWGLVSRS